MGVESIYWNRSCAKGVACYCYYGPLSERAGFLETVSLLVVWDEENAALNVLIPVVQGLYSKVHLVSSQESMKPSS